MNITKTSGKLYSIDLPISQQSGPQGIYQAEEKIDGKFRTIEEAYFSPTGIPWVQEKTALEGGNLKQYEVKQLQLAESGAIEVRGNRVLLSYTRGGKTSTSEEEFSERFVIGSTLLDYLRRHQQELLQGDTLRVRFAVLSRTETVGFGLSLDVRKPGRLRVRMSPTSPVIALFLKPFYFTFSDDLKRIVEFQGIAMPKVARGSGWQDFRTQTLYEDPARLSLSVQSHSPTSETP
ncbi:MAG: hypothetical protein H7222_09610 [Methylotenera sp.]|nr:hypothetical protein [Oligoflexia bacterium]